MTGCFPFNKNNNVILPPQEEYCNSSGSVCGYVHKKIGLNKYDKRLAIITNDGFLVLYKYFLFGVCSGNKFREPNIGRFYDLKTPIGLSMKLDDQMYLVRIKTKENKTLKLMLKGAKAGEWAAKLVNFKRDPIGHCSHEERMVDET